MCVWCVCVCVRVCACVCVCACVRACHIYKMSMIRVCSECEGHQGCRQGMGGGGLGVKGFLISGPAAA